jgi:glucokinase
MRIHLLLVKKRKKFPNLLNCGKRRKGIRVILAGDIGGTHTRLALFDRGKQIALQKFSSQGYSDLDSIVREFLQSHKQKIQAACFGIAGPVREGRCQATNLPWVVDAAHVSRALDIPTVHLLNDLEANAYGLKVLKKEELFCLNKGTPQKGNQALIAAGTGLGEAGLYWDGKEHRPFACEGGHTDFGPRNPMEVELLVYLKQEFGHVSYERIVSGPGIHILYQFLIETKREKASSQVTADMTKNDPSAVISEYARQNKDPACVHAIHWFLSLYGAEAGNLALKFLSLGGFFIGGGIAPHLIEQLKKGPFVTSFVDKGRFKGLLESIPIWVVLNDQAALLGAAYYAEQRT